MFRRAYRDYRLSGRRLSRLSTSAAFSFLLIIISGPVKPSKWQKWGPWSHCSTTCGPGDRVRARACSGSHGSCSGEWTETKDCLLDKCPVIIGKWQEWGPWAQCSATCGKGARIRARPCSKNDRSCPGEPTETKDCLVAECTGFPFSIILIFSTTDALVVILV